MTAITPDDESKPAAVAAARAAEERLAELDELPVAAHIAIYDDVHAVLQDALAELDEG
jgi:hypothetical protein